MTSTGLGAIEEFGPLAEANGRYVIAGQPGAVNAFLPHLWYSTDALNWQLAELPAQPAVTRFSSVIAGGSGFVAFGIDFETADAPSTVVYSSADGSRWTVVGRVARDVDKAASVDGRLVAFGTTQYGQSPAVWLSADGAEWQPVSDQSALLVDEGLVALANAAGFLWAVRSDDPAEDGNRHPVELWRSSSGEHWDKVGELPNSISVSSATLAVGAMGWAITAERVTFAGASGAAAYDWYAWYSADGTEWHIAGSAPRHTDFILADDFGFVAVGGDYGGCCAVDASSVKGQIWTSDGGGRWTRRSDKGWNGRVIEALISGGPSVAGVGIDWRLFSDDPLHGLGVVWTVERSALTSDGF